MLIKNVFIAVGIALALFAVAVSIVGLRKEDFPSRKALIGLSAVALVLVIGTAFFAVELSIEEAKEREEHNGIAIGEEA